MPLTPADVHNVAFNKPPIGKRGYAEDEVDQFLDLIEDTLGRLQDENDALRAQVEELQAELEAGGSGSTTFVPTESSVDEAALRQRIEAELSREYEAKLKEARADAERAQREAEKAREEARRATEAARTSQQQSQQQQPQQAYSRTEEGAASAETHMQAARVLSLAQEMADRLTNDARNESNTLLDEARTAAEKTINEAKDEAERTLAGASQESESMLTDAKRRSEAIISEATAQSEATVEQAEEKAALLRHEADRKYNETMTTMKQQQSVYENRIEELRVFEREYRTRLKNLLETKLSELESHHTSAPHSHGGNH